MLASGTAVGGSVGATENVAAGAGIVELTWGVGSIAAGGAVGARVGAGVGAAVTAAVGRGVGFGVACGVG